MRKGTGNIISYETLTYLLREIGGENGTYRTKKYNVVGMASLARNVSESERWLNGTAIWKQPTCWKGGIRCRNRLRVVRCSDPMRIDQRSQGLFRRHCRCAGKLAIAGFPSLPSVRSCRRGTPSVALLPFTCTHSHEQWRVMRVFYP